MTKSVAKKAHGAKMAKKNGLGLWVKACKQHGYMVKGVGFRPVPKKGTPEYKKIHATFLELKGN